MDKIKRNIYLLISISFFQGFVFYGSISTIYRLDSGLTLSNIFLIESISWIITFLLEVPFGMFSDRFGYKKTLILSNLIFFFSKIVFFISSSFPLFLFERILLAFAVAGLSGCDSALLYESSPKGKKEKHYGLVRTFGTIGLVIASILSPILISRAIKLTAFYTVFPYGIAFVLSFFLKDIIKPHKREEKTILKSLTEILKNPSTIIFIILGAIITEMSISIGGFLNQPQYIKCGIEIKYFGLIFACMQIIPAASSGTYKLLNRIKREKLIGIIVLIMIAAGFTLSITGSAIFSIISVALISLSSAIFQPLFYSKQNQNLKDNNRATVLSIYSMIIGLTSGSINIVIGKVAELSLSGSFILISALLAVFSTIYFIKK